MKPLQFTQLWTLGLVGAIGCIDTNTAVFVAPRIEAVSLTVGRQTLGTTLQGSFDLMLELGARASGPSKVTLGQFSLKKADGTVAVLEQLPVSTQASLPIAVAEDSEVEVPVRVDTGGMLLPQELADAVCAGELAIYGAIQDSLQTGSTPVTSLPFTVGGCP